ncbi:MAG TPA: Sec-independent protein translocase protein TatB [Rhizomicrobium sp.]|jgi:sec-independent protein translocase protein TatB|nr:Sec-independent protein translocase protein TatB [Rhizomicrobium sp.]
MIDLSWSHILIVLVVALVVVGPKDLPRLMHMVGRWLAKARAMADQFKKSFDEMSRQAELDELRTELQALRNERPFAAIEQSLHEPVMPSDAAAKGPAVGDAGGAEGRNVQHDPAPSVSAAPGGDVP